ncbi:MAG: T9SS type A sorting domain-containing protein [candidate division WOR-3 bacterium]
MATRARARAGILGLLLVASVIVTGRAWAVDYTSAQSGNWSDTLTWNPRGVPAQTDNVTINHSVTNNIASAVNNITIGSTGTFVQSSASCSLQVWGNWTNNGTVNITAGPVKFRGSTNSTIGGSNATTFYLVRCQKSTVSCSLFLTAAVTISANNTYALHIDTGTVVTNGRNLTVNGGTSARVTGGTGARSRLVCNGGSTVNVNYIYGWSVSVSVHNPTTVVNVTTQWDVVNSGQRVDITAGTVNILGTSSTSLRLLTNNSGWGWFMYGGTLNLYGGITTSIGAFFTATDSAKVCFVGTSPATVLLMSGTSAYNRWALNDLRIQKTGSTAVVTCTTASGPVGGNVTALVGLTVNSGNTLRLRGEFRAVFGNVTNNGTIVVANTSVGKHVTVNGTFTNSGTFDLGPRVLRLGTASAAGTVTNTSGATFSAVGTSATDTATVIAVSSSYPYAFTVQSGATIAARYARFQWMNTSGINVASGATVHSTNNFSNCTFEHGSITGPMLKLENSQNISMNEVNFYGTAGYNIEKIANAGWDSVMGGVGNRWGSAYENDPNGRVYWEPPGDVGVTRILAPVGTILYGTVVTPRAVVTNFGPVNKPFWVKFDIGTVYTDTQYVASLAPGDSVIVNFTNWTATTGGLLATKCSTRLYGDGNSSNDKASGSCFVLIVVDVGVTRILAPTGVVDSGTVVAPSCSVRNYGSLGATFTATMRIPPYTANRIVINLPPDSTRLVSGFANWTARQRGWNVVTCTTSLSGDMNNTNDFMRESVFVQVHDVGARVIVAPTGTLVPGPVTPRCTITNYGNTVEPTWAYFAVWQGATQVWLDSVSLAGWQGDTLVEFGTYNAGAGAFTTAFWTALGTDQVHANDTVRGSFMTGTVDVAVTAITAPTGSIDTAATVTPAATVKNNGSLTATFDVWFFIDSAGTRIYTSTRNIAGLAPGASAPVTFDEKPKPHFIGEYATRCSVYIAFDGDPANDVKDGTFSFRGTPPPPPGWTEKEPIPAGAKPVKDGGWLSFSDLGGVRKVFAAVGNKQPDFYVFDADGGTWTKKADWPAGTEAKPPSKGAAATALALEPNTRIFALKGNNTLGFWSYDVVSDSWKQLKDIPQGTGKKIKGGSDLVYHDGKVYCLKGITNEFLLYNPATDSWTPLPNAPAAKYDKGSWLCLDEENGKIYCHQAKDHGFYAYDIAAGTWGSALKGMPTLNSLGKKKKSKDGGSAAYYAGYIFALKGGNTQEFWKYAINGDSWTQLEDIPLAGRSGKNKKVKGGGDITRAALPGPGLAVPVDLPAMKGNGVNDFYFYNTGEVLTVALPRAEQRGVMALTGAGRRASLSVTPNPLAGGFATISYSLSQPSAAVVRVYDATGRAVLVQGLALSRTGSVGLDLRTLAAGVYLVKLTAENTSVTHKLVIER